MATATDCVRSKNKLLKGDLPLQEHKPLTDLSQSHFGALQSRSQGKTIINDEKVLKKTHIKVSKGSYSYNGDEETMKALVAEHGAVVTG